MSFPPFGERMRDLGDGCGPAGRRFEGDFWEGDLLFPFLGGEGGEILLISGDFIKNPFPDGKGCENFFECFQCLGNTMRK